MFRRGDDDQMGNEWEILVLDDKIPFSEPGLIAQCPPTSFPPFRPFYSPRKGVGCVIC